MADSKYSSYENFIRLTILLNETTPRLREIFRSRYKHLTESPWVDNSKCGENFAKTIGQPVFCRILDQEKKLVKSGYVDEWDQSLLCPFLIRIDFAQNKSQRHEFNSQNLNINKLVLVRNILAHLPDKRLDPKEFKNLWKVAAKATINLGGNPVDVDRILTSPYTESAPIKFTQTKMDPPSSKKVKQSTSVQSKSDQVMENLPIVNNGEIVKGKPTSKKVSVPLPLEKAPSKQKKVKLKEETISKEVSAALSLIQLPNIQEKVKEESVSKKVSTPKLEVLSSNPESDLVGLTVNQLKSKAALATLEKCFENSIKLYTEILKVPTLKESERLKMLQHRADDYLESIEQNPREEKIRLNLALIDAQDIIKLRSEWWKPNLTIARILQRQKKWSQAIEACEKVLGSNPGDKQILEVLAIIHNCNDEVIKERMKSPRPTDPVIRSNKSTTKTHRGSPLQASVRASVNYKTGVMFYTTTTTRIIDEVRLKEKWTVPSGLIGTMLQFPWKHHHFNWTINNLHTLCSNSSVKSHYRPKSSFVVGSSDTLKYQAKFLGTMTMWSRNYGGGRLLWLGFKLPCASQNLTKLSQMLPLVKFLLIKL